MGLMVEVEKVAVASKPTKQADRNAGMGLAFCIEQKFAGKDSLTRSVN